MDKIESRDLSSSSDSEDEKPSSIRGKTVYRLFGRGRPVHMILGGGKLMVVAFTVPRFYEKYEDQVDAFAEKAETVCSA